MSTVNVSDLPLRVLHATECAASGTLTVMVALAHELANAGAKQMVLYSQRAETPVDLVELFPAGVEFMQVPAARGLHLGFIRNFSQALRRLADEWKPDVVHLHSSKAGFVGRFALAALRSKVNVLYSPHGLSFLDPDRTARNAVFKSLEYLAAKTPSTAVACGCSEAQLLSALSGREAIMLENPVDDTFFTIDPRPTDAPVIVSVGRLSRQKAPDRFAAVARLVRQQRPDARFVWIGDGDAHYAATLREAGCEMLGWRTQGEVAASLSTATVYLQTSLWEGLPVSVIQALAAGVPCVVQDCVGNRDAVAHESTGFVAESIDDLAARIVCLIDDSDMRAVMSARARRDARRRFGRAAFGRRVRQLYELADREQLVAHDVLESCERQVIG
jgi:glycosyltransferase involved in cell wall biosynthesis